MIMTKVNICMCAAGETPSQAIHDLVEAAIAAEVKEQPRENPGNDAAIAAGAAIAVDVNSQERSAPPTEPVGNLMKWTLPPQ